MYQLPVGYCYGGGGGGGGASLSNELFITNKYMSTLCFDEVTSIILWPHSDNGAINVPQLRSRVLDCYLAANEEILQGECMFIENTLNFLLRRFLYLV